MSNGRNTVTCTGNRPSIGKADIPDILFLALAMSFLNRMDTNDNGYVLSRKRDYRVIH